MGRVDVVVVDRLRCPGCGSEVGVSARFCPGCGAPISAPVAPSPSGIVYLFGDRFAGRDKLLSVDERLPCSDARVQKEALAREMFRAAFASLAKEGYLSLALGQKKTLLFKSGAVFVTLKKRETFGGGGLEANILQALTGDPRKDGVEDVVGRALGDESIDPWGIAIEQTKEHLLGLGYFVKEERSGLGRLIPGRRLQPQCERIATLQGHVPAIQVLLEGLSSRDPALNKQLGEDIKKGITSRYKTREIDADE